MLFACQDGQETCTPKLCMFVWMGKKLAHRVCCFVGARGASTRVFAPRAAQAFLLSTVLTFLVRDICLIKRKRLLISRWLFASLVAMAGLGNVEDVPDTLIGRFIGRLNHIQFKLVQHVSSNVSVLIAKTKTLKEDGIAVQNAIVTQSMHISGIQKPSSEHAEALAGHEARLCHLASQMAKIGPMGQTPAPSPSHRGPGTVMPSPTAHATFDFDTLEMGEATSISMYAAAAATTKHAADGPAAPTVWDEPPVPASVVIGNPVAATPLEAPVAIYSVVLPADPQHSDLADAVQQRMDLTAKIGKRMHEYKQRQESIHMLTNSVATMVCSIQPDGTQERSALYGKIIEHAAYVLNTYPTWA